MDPFVGMIAIFPYNFAPKGWLPCNGQLIPINQNQALFSLLGTTYGGDGRVNFALPNLQGRVPVGMGGGRTLGERAGEASHTLTQPEMPAHTHQLSGSSSPASLSNPTGNVFAATSGNNYGTATPVVLSPAVVPAAGGSQPHENRQPYTVLSYCIAIQGIFPSRD
jgi:microcystin-dependent protein